MDSTATARFEAITSRIVETMSDIEDDLDMMIDKAAGRTDFGDVADATRMLEALEAIRKYSAAPAPSGCACPKCDEARMDYLEWTDSLEWSDGDELTCSTCDHTYTI